MATTAPVEKTPDATPTYEIDLKEARVSGSDAERGVGEIEVNSIFNVDRNLEKRLLWKFDIHILPMLAIMYLFK